MVNDLSGKKHYAVIIAAIIVTFIVMMGGVVSGLVLAVRDRHAPDTNREYAQSLLVEAASNLKSSLSAMRIVNESEPADELAKTALVHAVRAETALECVGGEWSENRSKEAFLNDVATVLHSNDSLQAAEKAEVLYEYSVKFYASVSDGTPFEYNGEIMGGSGVEDDDNAPPTEEQISAASELISSALNTDSAQYLGAWGGHMEFNIERGGLTGYALVCESKICEFSFMRGDDSENVDIDGAEQIALELAAACGYDDLVVLHSETIGRSIAVIMCRNLDGALACDDAASAVVYGGEVVAFSAGSCDNDHAGAPKAKVSENDARSSASGAIGEGVLVVRTVNGRERICYRYRFDLDDGVHYVFVCAENGKQMQVK